MAGTGPPTPSGKAHGTGRDAEGGARDGAWTCQRDCSGDAGRGCQIVRLDLRLTQVKDRPGQARSLRWIDGNSWQLLRCLVSVVSGPGVARRLSRVLPGAKIGPSIPKASPRAIPTITASSCGPGGHSKTA